MIAFLDAVGSGRATVPPAERIESMSRRARARQLAAVLEGVPTAAPSSVK
jgi:hypothetical protein